MNELTFNHCFFWLLYECELCIFLNVTWNRYFFSFVFYFCLKIKCLLTVTTWRISVITFEWCQNCLQNYFPNKTIFIIMRISPTFRQRIEITMLRINKSRKGQSYSLQYDWKEIATKNQTKNSRRFTKQCRNRPRKGTTHLYT